MTLIVVVPKRNKSREDIVALFEQDGEGGMEKKIIEKAEKRHIFWCSALGNSETLNREREDEEMRMRKYRMKKDKKK